MSLKIDIYGNNLVIDDKLSAYVNKKAPKLERYMKDIVEVKVDLSYAKSARNAVDRNVAQITLRGKNYLLRSEVRRDDIYVAFDNALEKLQRRIERYKGKYYRGSGDRVSIRKIADREDLEEEVEVKKNKIVKRKKFVIKPMDELEAIEQMNLLGHEDFFLFYNSESGLYNLLYRRRDDGYGIIETEIG